MKRIRYYIILIPILTACLSPRYKVTENRFKSNRELWALTLSELKVDSINQKGFPAKYSVLREFDARQMGDHKYDDTIKEYGYNWKPQKEISFNKKSNYYCWYDSSKSKKVDTLPITFFQKDTWYLLTNWQPASAGGGIYHLFVYVNEKGAFEKHFDIQTGSW
ncbi:MAG: hypothetical protein K0S23_2737 [Fluviicola sp.]|uniref:hypothetical protein n=1 Tax=Fluviicola sp. TaxID=1917219 RepID=UPI00263688A3|nr:hypothetical protein [Fluviicola sp.]MDF3028430.1 hypothetical protein [Fluviicola sp.]